MKLKPYPKYKNSGIQWIGKIPEGWEVNRLKSFIPYIINGQWGEEPNGDGFDMIVLRVADFGEFNFNLVKELTMRSVKDPKLRIRDDDLVIEKSGGGEKQLVGRVVQLTNTSKREKYTYSNFISKLEISNRMNKTFLNYYFKAFYNNRVNFNYIKQTTGIQNLDIASLIQREYFAYPTDKNYQKSIVSFLDKKTAKIDALIGKDKKLVELLKEKRAALINHTVTKGLPVRASRTQIGLDPNVKLKDSGIEWIGKIPEGWKIHRLKSFIPYIINGQWGEEPNGDGFDMIVLRVADFGEFNFNLVKELTLRSVKDPKLRIRDGDLVIEKSGGGEKQLVGRVIQLKNISKQKKYTYSNFLGKLIIKETISKDYLKYYFKAFYNARVNYRYIKQTTGIQNLDIMALLQKEFFAFPQNKQQQTAIANYLDKATAKIDKTIQKIEQKIKLLEEYKKSLIHHTVTGKIDVRGLEY